MLYCSALTINKTVVKKISLNLYPIQIQSQLDHQFSSYERTNRLTDFFILMISLGIFYRLLIVYR